VLAVLVHHGSSTSRPLVTTSSTGTYDTSEIQRGLSERQRRYLLFCYAFTGCDTDSAIGSYEKSTLFGRLCAGDMDEHMNVFLGVQATKEEVVKAGIAVL